MSARDKYPSILDVSFAGAKISVNEKQITDFMDDANPIEISPIRVTEPEISCNGTMFRCARANPIVVSITVIPTSESDRTLRELFVGGFYQFYEYTSKSISLSISLGENFYEFRNGFILSGPYGISASADGKMRGNTYTFAFRDIY